ncbi:hypothetical protein L211DRAFT_266146 [Terfezia boudieri ATCC MYA-4762]|uniref:Uncharacterized protein n=1 Tax=Terfezia boudieri ATCC MYA-4762 TaxID=1051890 RepID=A0A3N4M6D0_9PEZI|nr:hypothetical protein L211DRAFT_266146 [Terfezia boudieri ATCC MYA-4762]
MGANICWFLLFTTVRAFLGIPYSVDALGWKPEKPLEHAPPGGELVNASELDNCCYQFQYKTWNRDPAMGEEIVKWSDIQMEKSENRLNVNIWASSKRQRQEQAGVTASHGVDSWWITPRRR